MSSTKTYFAEVIESCLDHYMAQSWQWQYFPAFGSLVAIQDSALTVYGVVTHIQTGSMDPMRTPFAYQKTEEELLREQPQIFEFLKTHFKVQVLGYSKKETPEHIYYVLPPKPPKIHTFVQECDPTTIAQFFSSSEFLPLLFAFAHNIQTIDEMLLTLIKQLHDKHIFNQQQIDDFCQNFTLLTGNDYRRLKLFLKRVEPLLR